jgi:RNA polymerase sigma factor for flagellar operon FliA
MPAKPEIDKYRRMAQPAGVSLDRNQREKLVGDYAPMVKYMADHLAFRLPDSVPIDDLYSAGLFGLLDAVDKFDPQTGNHFRTYAKHRIRGAMLDELRKTDWMPRSIRQEVGKVEKAVRRLQTELMREPEEIEIAAELGVSLSAYHKMLDRIHSVGCLRLRDLAGDGVSPERISPLIDNRSPMDELERKELKRQAAEALAGLKEKEQLVISLYYYDEMTLKEIAAILDLTESRICQIHTQAIVKLRSRLKSYRSVCD